VLPRSWVVERTLSWLVRWRRLVRGYERLPETHEAFVKWAMLGLMLNRLARPPGRKAWSRAPWHRAPGGVVCGRPFTRPRKGDDHRRHMEP
jgi:hypothetical protein